MTAVEIHDLATDERRVVDSSALFLLIGSVPHTAWLGGQIPLDEKGFVLTGTSGNGYRSVLETGRAGVFAVGDVRSGSVKRVASAVGEGAIAVRLVHEFLDTIEGR
jgi:thioredoxin reductase (NADPH)